MQKVKLNQLSDVSVICVNVLEMETALLMETEHASTATCTVDSSS